MNSIVKRLNFFAPVFARFPKQILSCKYYKTFHKRLDWKNPVQFHEKVFWLSLNTDTSQWSRLADKYGVREYVSQLGLGYMLNDLYGVYETPESIDFDSLPNAFVLKTNNGCLTNLLIKDKSKIDIQETRDTLAGWMKFHYGDLTAQPHYTRIKPLIIAEKLLVQDGDADRILTDYKFYCFNGKPMYCMVCSGRKTLGHQYDRMLYDMDWNSMEHVFGPGPQLDMHQCPKCFDEMKKAASLLCQGHKFVRVDLYNIDDKPIFGELTFTPGTGLGFTPEFQKQLGDLIII
ncbi:MAG: hypothetical protein KBT10_07680 [Bacteroidales bacterium]|nr:hypothetical protein [Candidatus Sodaliphilus aphodohippi]